MIELRGVSKRFGDLVVLDGVDFSVRKGETVALLGPSGVGKSVLLKHINGLIHPDRGEVWVDGQNVIRLKRKDLARLRSRIGYVFQYGALFDSMTVADNIKLGITDQASASDEAYSRARAEQCLGMVNLDPAVAEKYPAELSGGMKKRVGLARAIALQPRIILYDEPTTGLDPSNIEKITELIMDLREKLGVTSVVVTHDMHSAFKVSDRIALLHQGRIAVAGTPAEIEHSDLKLVRDFISGHLEAD